MMAWILIICFYAGLMVPMGAGYGEMDIKDVGKVLRWMGYSASFDVQVMLTREVDVDESGTLDHVELRKLVRRFQEKALLRVFVIFFITYHTFSVGLLDVLAASHGVSEHFRTFLRRFELVSGAHDLDAGLSKGPHARGAAPRA